ncbi:MAG: ankyrin repeat domain-containing protein, partial [Phycisphaerales bacterium]
NCVDDSHRTPLDWAMEEGKTDVAKVLLDRGASLTAGTWDESSPSGSLTSAIDDGFIDLVELLLPRVKDLDSHLPLHAAVSGRFREAESRFKSAYPGADPHSWECEAACWRAMHGRRIRMLDLLLAKGVNINAADRRGCAPLHLAALHCEADIVEWLLARGADPNITTAAPLESWTIWGGRFPFGTPLHVAAVRGDASGIEVLIRYGADVNAKDHEGFTPLYRALRAGNAETARALMAAGAETVVVKNEPGQRMLHDALLRGCPDLALALLENGADVEEQDEQNETVLHMATRLDHLELTRALFAHHADVNARNEGGATPLHLAVRGGRVDLISLLLMNGADVTARDNNGDTPLHSAALHGHEDVVALLLSHGADAAIKNEHGRTALDEATRRGHNDTAQLLQGKQGAR